MSFGRSAALLGAGALLIVSASAGAATSTVWESLADPATIGMTSGFDLLVGTADDVPPDASVEGFNSQGNLAHSFFIHPDTFNIPAASSFSNRLFDRSGTPLGAGALITDFSIEGRSEDFVRVNGLPLGVPFSIVDDPAVLPHEMNVADDGRSFSLLFHQKSCADAVADCDPALAEIDTVSGGIILLRGDDPAALVASAPAAFHAFFDVWTSGAADVPAYLEYLEGLAPPDWAAISLTVFAYLVDEGSNLSGGQAALVDDHVLVGVIPSYTLPEPAAAAGLGTVCACLLAGARLQSRR